MIRKNDLHTQELFYFLTHQPKHKIQTLWPSAGQDWPSALNWTYKVLWRLLWRCHRPDPVWKADLPCKWNRFLSIPGPPGIMLHCKQSEKQEGSWTPAPPKWGDLPPVSVIYPCTSNLFKAAFSSSWPVALVLFAHPGERNPHALCCPANLATSSKGHLGQNSAHLHDLKGIGRHCLHAKCELWWAPSLRPQTPEDTKPAASVHQCFNAADKSAAPVRAPNNMVH